MTAPISKYQTELLARAQARIAKSQVRHGDKIAYPVDVQLMLDLVGQIESLACALRIETEEAARLRFAESLREAMLRESRDAYKQICERLGICMTCAVRAPEPYGCSDCLNTGWNQGHPHYRELLARRECDRRGLDPDDVCADGGVMAWMVVDKEISK